MMELLQNNQIGLCLGFFLLPFLQEDVSILGAASAFASGLGDPFLAFFFTALGLTASATLKYGLGRAATTREWAQKFTQNPKVLTAGDRVKANLGKSLFTARFVPPVRIPFYIGAGFFSVSFPKFLIYVVSSAVLYLGIAFGLFHLFGDIAGEKMKIYLPIIAVTALILYFIVSKFMSRNKNA